MARPRKGKGFDSGASDASPPRGDRPSVGSRLAAGLFLVGFFAALPFWFLTTQDGALHVACGGVPWQCTVTREWLWNSQRENHRPDAVRAVSTRVRFKGQSSSAWQLVFEEQGQAVAMHSGARTDRAVVALADRLEQARVARAAVDVVLEASATYYLAIALVVVFAGAGAFLAWIGGRGPSEPPPRPSRSSKGR